MTNIDPRILAKFGHDYVSISNNEVRYNCPFCEHAGKTPDIHGHLYVSLDRLVYFCHRCGTKGTLNKINVKGYSFEQSPTDRETTESLRKLFMGDSRELYDISSSIPIERKNEYLPYEIKAIRYMESRGFNLSVCRYYGIRVGNPLSRYRNRIIVPNEVFTYDDGTVKTDMFVARYFNDDGLDRGRKYLNPYGNNRRTSVFNLHRIRQHSYIIITEGCFTSMSAGINSVATYGKYVTDCQINKILSKEPSALLVALDPDARKDAFELCRRLKRITATPVYLVDVPEGEDANSLGHGRFMSYVKEAQLYDPVVMGLKSFV